MPEDTITIKTKHLWIVGIAAAVGAPLLYFGLPIVAAVNRYEAAKANDDYAGMCSAHPDVADAWASAGFAGKSAEWRRGAALECLIAEHRAAKDAD